MTDHVEQNLGSIEADPNFDPRAQNEAREAAGETDARPESTLESLQSEVERARNEAAASQDRYLRALAEMENYKKRIERTYTDLAKNSKKELLRKLLGVKDNLERALHYAGSSESGESILEGVRLTQYQLEQLLAQEGVREIEADGKPFDPRLEEAVHSVHRSSVPDHQVVEVVRKGYTYSYTNHDENEVLRPAQVVVNVHKSKEL
jgi:molecular chaperone GrpE